MSGPLLKDSRWVRQSFLVRASDLERVDIQNRTWSTVNLKYTDTTPGGNIAINPPPQFTRWADVKSPGVFLGNRNGKPGTRGMGRYYSEAIDDNSQIIHMRFGVPQHTPLSQFFTGFYDTGAGQLARTGRATSAFYYLGRAATFVVSVMSWKLLAVHLLGVGAKFALSIPSSKYYSLKPTMPLYWNAVTTMLNQISVYRGIIPRIGSADMNTVDGGTNGNDAIPYTFSQLHDMLPDVFKPNGGIDVFALANRAQRLARNQDRRKEQLIAAQTRTLDQAGLARLFRQIYEDPIADGPRPSLTNDGSSNSENSYLNRWFATQVSRPGTEPGEQLNTQNNNSGSEEMLTSQNVDDGFFDFLKAELDDGGAFASFRVNSTGPINESFSNQAGESDIAQKINGISASARSTNFSFGNGNLVGGAVGATIGAIVGAVKDVGKGIMDQLEISGLAALGGAAYVDIPKHWQSSQASLPRMNYTVQLVSPYGNPISQLFNIYIPLCMLLAGALPLSTGKQSYTSPFLLEIYDQGRCQSRLAMIDSMSITRGTGNLGFDADGHALAIDVNFSVVDLSSVMHMPISQGWSLTQTALAAGGAVAGGVGGAAIGATGGPITAAGGAVVGSAIGAAAGAGVFSEDTVFTDYMAILAGLGLADQIYQMRKLRLNLTQANANFDSFTSKARFASFLGDTMVGRAVSAVYKGTYRDTSTVR